MVCAGIRSTNGGDIAKEPSFEFLNRNPHENR